MPAPIKPKDETYIFRLWLKARLSRWLKSPLPCTCGSKEEEWGTADSTHRLHNVKLLPVLNLMDLVYVFHWWIIEIHPLPIKEVISLQTKAKKIDYWTDHNGVIISFTFQHRTDEKHLNHIRPLEVDSPSSWQRYSDVYRAESNIFHPLSQTSSSFPAGCISNLGCVTVYWCMNRNQERGIIYYSELKQNSNSMKLKGN